MKHLLATTRTLGSLVYMTSVPVLITLVLLLALVVGTLAVGGAQVTDRAIPADAASVSAHAAR